jgi:membrane protease YdiL (CAAX protease family)
MTYSPTIWDFTILAALIACLAVDPLLTARVKAAIESGRHPRARLSWYWYNIAITWSLTLIVFALWVAFGRPWSALWLGTPHLWRFSVGLLLAAVHLWYALRGRNKMLAKPHKFARYRELFDSVSILAARTPQERRLFSVVAVTAGIGEEVLLRGFVLSLFASMFGLWIGAVVNVVIFAFGHAYQGRTGIIRTGVFGAFITVIVVATGSLVPAILIHMFQDLIAGDIISRVFSAAPNGQAKPDLTSQGATVPV